MPKFYIKLLLKYLTESVWLWSIRNESLIISISSLNLIKILFLIYKDGYHINWIFLSKMQPSLVKIGNIISFYWEELVIFMISLSIISIKSLPKKSTLSTLELINILFCYKFLESSWEINLIRLFYKIKNLV